MIIINYKMINELSINKKSNIKIISMNMDIGMGITITFGDVAENHINNQKMGLLSNEGITCDELKSISKKLLNNGIGNTLISLDKYLDKSYTDYFENLESSILIIHNGINIFTHPDNLFNELKDLDYDKKALMGKGANQKVRNKIKRYNLCFSDFDQEPEYNLGKGRVINFNKLPHLNHIRKYLPILINNKCNDLQAEANCYYDINKCLINYHGDKERKIVVGLRIGADFPLFYCWYHNSQRICDPIEINLKHGDIYIMSEKSVGEDWLKRSFPTLRHAAGRAVK